MKKSKIIIVLMISLFCILLVIFASFFVGSRQIPMIEILTFLKNPVEESFVALVIKERIPRTVFALLAGASLGVAGSLMQAITRNPISDPSILGVNTGASLFVVVGIAYFQIHSASQYIIFALAGAFLAAAFVYGIASIGYGGTTPMKLALAGAATSAALSSLISAVMLPRTDVMNAFRFWQVGSVSGATWEGILAALPFLLMGCLIAMFLIPSLNVLALGDEVAVSLGVRVGLIRGIGAISGVVLCGVTTAIAGPIGFVGLMVPHMIRLLLGENLKFLIPMSAIAGAVLLTGADVVGRLLGSPGELEVGIVTAFLGAPILILIIRKAKVKA